ncbi:uncharacterized protein LOC108100943 [Drosophila ficusphila]|uniref:uncharacterized protein LOC108100943 n=1 Tax=Drosophila ficusphila TaxID=30025 RepID=UPI0007E66FA9|nr:uncharacterized protein LOC108100943 [Drosophila ficusphila]
MKAALVLVCIALFVGIYNAAYVCDPDTNNAPDCTNATNLNQKIRNFFDPTRYWKCEAVGTQAPVAVLCEKELNGTTGGFDPTLKNCTVWSNWQWTPYC